MIVADEIEIPENKHTTTVLYKSKNGELKELHVVQSLNPDQRRFTYADLQMLGRQIALMLKEDAF